MKKLLSTTTALSLAIMPMHPWPLLAQAAASIAEDGSILAADGTILCQVQEGRACDPAEFGLLPIPDGDNPLLRSLQPDSAEAAAPDTAAPEAEAPADTLADTPADAPADTPAEEPAVSAAESEAAPIAEAPTEPAASPESAPEAVPEAPLPEAAPEAPLPDARTEAQSDVPELAAPAEAPAEAEPLPDAVEQAFDAARAAERSASEPMTDEPVQPVDVPEVSEEAATTVEQLLAGEGSAVNSLLGAAAAVLGGGERTGETTSTTPAAEAPAPQEVTETTIAESDTRASFEDFAKAPEVLEGGRKKSGLSDLEKAGLLALGAIVVGKILTDGREVVANTGDRVVVRAPDGGYQVYKDDDTLLRRPGATVRTESYSDGSTRTTVTREDGTQVVTIRDATGRVLRRASYDARGIETVLIDDLMPEERIDVSTLPPPRPDRITIASDSNDAALRAALARVEAERIGRSFSLRQIREIKEVRHLAAVIDVDNITFDTGSAVIRTTEARKLADLGRIMSDILDENPYELFLVEGHTDAVGSAASNLALSDRRAESVALALTEYFAIPPENMVVQGYGEYDLRIETEADERRNRRVAVRLVSPLMQTAAR